MGDDGTEFATNQFEGICGNPCTADSTGVATIDDAINGRVYSL
jgi:hypothetical protein